MAYLAEVPLYGSRRVGLRRYGATGGRVVLDNRAAIDAPPAKPTDGWRYVRRAAPVRAERERGGGVYEVSNHLSNVLTTVADYRATVAGGAFSGVAELAGVRGYVPGAREERDYYPFGLPVPDAERGTVQRDAASLSYRYSFNGKEDDASLAGAGVAQDLRRNGAGAPLRSPVPDAERGTVQRDVASLSYRYSFNGKEDDGSLAGAGVAQDLRRNGAGAPLRSRLYNKASARFMSVDPLASANPHQSPYAFADNSPIAQVDYEGGDGILYLIALGDPAEAAMVVKYAQQIANELGLNVEVKLFEHGTPEDFNKDFLDDTDVFAVFGENPTQVHKYRTDKGIPETGDLYAFKFSYEHPERSRSRTVEVAAFNSVALDKANGERFTDALSGESDQSKVLGFLAVHGFGHASGDITHGEGFDQGFMSEGNTIDATNKIFPLLTPERNDKVVPKGIRG